MFKIDNLKTTATIWSELDCRDKVENPNFTNFLDVRCKSCGNINGKNLKINYTEIVSINYSYWEKENVEIKNEDCKLRHIRLKRNTKTNVCQTVNKCSTTR